MGEADCIDCSLLHIEAVKMSESSQLGFHNLPFLAHRKSVKRGFEFTLMVVGKFVSWQLSQFLWLVMPHGKQVGYLIHDLSCRC